MSRRPTTSCDLEVLTIYWGSQVLFATIISSLPLSLSNFTVAKIAAARMFLALKATTNSNPKITHYREMTITHGSGKLATVL